MKSCDEMLESVLSKAKTDIAKRKQRTKTALHIGAAGLCLALILGLALAPRSPEQPIPTEGHIAAPPTQATPPTQGTEPTQHQIGEPTQPAEIEPPTKAKLYFLSYNDTQVYQNSLPAGVSIPVEGRLWVRTFYGLSEEEREAAKREFNAVVEAYKQDRAPYMGGIGGGGSRIESRDHILAMVIKGGLSLEFADDSQVLSVDSETTNGGGLGCGKMVYTQATTYGEGEHQVTYPVGTTLYGFFWNIGDERERALLRNPNMDFSTIKDTIVITVKYTNGATEVIRVDVTLDDEGKIYMTLRSDNKM